MDLPYDKDDLELKLLPENMQLSLMRVGTLLTGWEMIRSTIIGNVKDFFYDDSDYQRDVSSRGPIFDASTSWLIDMEALTDSDVLTLRRLREHRNEVAHEIMRFLVDPTCQVDSSVLQSARDVIKRLGQFWGRIAADADPQWDGVDLDPEEIQSGYFLLFDYVLSVVECGRE